MFRFISAFSLLLIFVTPVMAQAPSVMPGSQYSVMPGSGAPPVGWCVQPPPPPQVVVKEVVKEVRVTVPGPERVVVREATNTVVLPAPVKPTWTIYFDFDANTPQAKCKEKLDAIAAYLKANPTHQVVLVGYADIRNRGAKDYNERLSTRRVQAVLGALGTRGISATQATMGWGGDRFPSLKKSDQSACPQLQPGKTAEAQTKGCQEDRRVTVAVQ